MQTQQIDRIEVFEPAATCDVRGGTFTYTNKDGQSCTADFYVRVCPTHETKYQSDPVAKALRVDAYNEQYIDACDNLMTSGCTNVVYKEASPSEFF